MGILFVILAAFFAASCNLCLRKSIDAGGSSRAYLVVQLSFSFFLMVLLNPVRLGDYGANLSSISLGLLGGAILGAFMWGLGKTLELGPPGLSLAILNTSSIMPAIVLALLFGSTYGHTYTLWNGGGSLLVAIGVLWAGWTSKSTPQARRWLGFVILIFSLHTLFLVYLQWWAMLLAGELPLGKLLPFHLNPVKIAWFMPSVFLAAASFQWVSYWRSGHDLPGRKEVLYGVIGGMTNGLCTYFLILAPQVATVWQNAMLFPIYSVGIIIFCNLWAQGLYHERVNWKANALCVVGLIMGTVAWASF